MLEMSTINASWVCPNYTVMNMFFFRRKHQEDRQENWTTCCNRSINEYFNRENCGKPSHSWCIVLFCDSRFGYRFISQSVTQRLIYERPSWFEESFTKAENINERFIAIILSGEWTLLKVYASRYRVIYL